MAEGDTILRLAQRIEPALAGRPVRARAPHPRGRAAGLEQLDGLSLEAARAHGKHLLLDFGPLVLHSHLGMNGGWHLYPPGARWRRPRRSAWAVLSADADPGPAAEHRAAGSADPDAGPEPEPRAAVELVQFGGPTLRVLRPEQARRDPTLRSLGPDLLAPEPFDLDRAVAALRRAGPQATLGEALLDQRLVAGIGNIFKSEGCFEVAIDPWRQLGSLTDAELAAMLAATRAMMLASVAGEPRPRQVYRRSGENCRRCGARIRARGQGDANRTTYWCAGCQG